MNKKGFSLVEMLTIMAIMSILSGVAVMLVSNYLAKSKEKAYETMLDSIYDAAVSYAMNTGINLKPGEETDKIYVANLVNEGYLEELIDPEDEGTCATMGENDGETSSDTEESSYITIKNNTTNTNSNEIESYKYTIHLFCTSGYTTGENGVVYPK